MTIKINFVFEGDYLETFLLLNHYYVAEQNSCKPKKSQMCYMHLSLTKEGPLAVVISYDS